MDLKTASAIPVGIAVGLLLWGALPEVRPLRELPESLPVHPSSVAPKPLEGRSTSAARPSFLYYFIPG